MYPWLVQNQKTREAAANDHSFRLAFVCDWYKTQVMCGKAFEICLCVFPDILDQNKIQEMCEKAIDTFLGAWNFVPDGFYAHKMLEDLDNIEDLDNDDFDELII